jgi:hypothetical protein
MEPKGARLYIAVHAFNTAGEHLGFGKQKTIDGSLMMISLSWKSCSLTSLAAERAHPRRRHKDGLFKSAPLSENHTRISKLA